MWNEFHIATNDQHAEMLSQELQTLGALAVTFQDAGDQPIFEPTAETIVLWKEMNVIALYEHTQAPEPIIRYLENQIALGKLSHFHVKQLADENWERRCLEGFEPIRCGNRLWICPSWHTPPDPLGTNIILDPGLAFGTGSHPTTQLCLEWLDNNIIDQNLVIDYGCGSGILAIAAIKLGAKKSIAIDIDPQALEATRINAVRNFLSENQLITQLASQPCFKKADILIANILANPLIKLASFFADLVTPAGKLVLSGILKEQTNDVSKAYQPWFSVQNICYREDWACLYLIKN